MCGEAITFGMSQSELSAGSGSMSCTSRPAPARRPSRSAAISAGSSMDKVLKVNVYLNDLKDYTAMNGVYATGKWGAIPPVRTTVAPAGGIPGDSLVEIDLIAFI